MAGDALAAGINQAFPFNVGWESMLGALREDGLVDKLRGCAKLASPFRMDYFRYTPVLPRFGYVRFGSVRYNSVRCLDFTRDSSRCYKILEMPPWPVFARDVDYREFYTFRPFLSIL